MYHYREVNWRSMLTCTPQKTKITCANSRCLDPSTLLSGSQILSTSICSCYKDGFCWSMVPHFYVYKAKIKSSLNQRWCSFNVVIMWSTCWHRLSCIDARSPTNKLKYTLYGISKNWQAHDHVMLVDNWKRYVNKNGNVKL